MAGTSRAPGRMPEDDSGQNTHSARNAEEVAAQVPFGTGVARSTAESGPSHVDPKVQNSSETRGGCTGKPLSESGRI